MSEIQSAAQWLGRLLYDEAKFVYKMENKVKELRDEFIWMQHFLRDIDESHSNNIMAKSWISQSRELCNEADDTIQKFCIMISVVTDRREGGNNILNRIIKYSKFVWDLRLLHQIGSDIDSLKQKISFLTSKLDTYGIKFTMGESSSSWLSRKRTTFKSSEKENIIGRKNDMNAVVDKLTKEECIVVSICGVAGVGKTFLAKKIFDHIEIRKHFEAFAWAYVSSPCQSSAVQQDLLSSLTSKSKEQISQMTDDELNTELRKVLCKHKCFIVLDGLWGNEVWDSLKKSFPFASPDFGSKLLITNQQEEVATHVHTDVYAHPLKPLNKDESKQLLVEKIKPFDIADQKDLERVEVIKEEILKHCDGLPLLISVLGGVLATKKTLKDWEGVEKHISSCLTEDHNQVPSWKRIQELSYYDLPFQLKPSFLYLGYFPTNIEIPTKKIIRLWEAEGLVSSSDDEISEDTVEDIAEQCLAELVERSLVQVGSRGLTGKLKTFLVHDLMRDLCIAKATQGNLLSIDKLVSDDQDQDQHSRLFNKYQHVGTSSDPYLDSQTIVENRIRRLAFYYTSDVSGKFPFRRLKHLRSLFVFNIQSSGGVLMPLERFLKIAFDKWRLLKVLHIENIEADDFPTEVGSLIYLRYLSLKGSCIFNLPSTIQNLRCLQTLDLRVLSFVIVRIPNVLWGMEQLLHLYLPSKLFNLRHKAKKLQLEGLKKLETLSNFSDKCKAEDVKMLTNLRRFSSCDYLCDDESIKPLLESSTSNLKHLERVSLKLEGHTLKGYSQTLASCRIRKLWVKGEVEQPIADKLPKNLTRLSLNNTKFQNDPMEVLEKLPSLKKLSLKHASYLGKDMKCSSRYFKELEYLTLKDLESLEDWIVEVGAMPNLSHLKINGCQKLKMLPDGLEFAKSLQELAISYMPFSFFNWKRPKYLSEWAQYPKVKHVPRINVSYVLDLEVYEDLPVVKVYTRQVPVLYESA